MAMRTEEWGGGGKGGVATPLWGFLSFSWTMFVFPSRALSDGQSKWLRDMTPKVAGGQGIFGSKCMLFQLISTIKVKLVDKMMKSTYLLFLLVKHKKSPIATVFAWFLTLSKIQDGDQVCWHLRSPAASTLIKYTSSCWEDQRPFTEGKIVSKYCNSREGFHRPPFPLVPRVGLTLRIRPSVNKQKKVATE